MRASLKRLADRRIAVSAAALSLTFLAAPSQADDLCPKSTAWFSCTLDNGKSVSVCGSPSTDPDQPKFGADGDSWLQYRYGEPGKIELSYPPGRGDRLWRKFLGAVSFAPGGTAERINFSFITKGTRYLIQANREGGEMRYSLAVISEDPVKTLAEFACTDVDADNLLPIALKVPCDPKDSGNETRGEECR